MRSLVRIASAVVLTTVAAVVAPQPAMAQAGDPIVFVHGYRGQAATWDDMKSKFAASGYAQDRLHAFEYPAGISNAQAAERLDAYVGDVLAKTRASKVDVVSHSMGALNSRHWMKFLGGADVVDDWVGLGAPNHGTDTARLCADVACQEMRPGSEFLNALNADDETHGAANYGNFWSDCDGVVQPARSAVLEGATNVRVGCVHHVDLVRNREVYDQVAAFVS
ncbi:triacylglycerol lipase [Saccharopolyspora erythraea NRRL 2338]|uniref:Secreted lipase n=2 Tax=Saccharopolyspora erythraea TaxID=1836 RepID=A4FK67_SACEN|nr:lipase [Saccharopolyspora erythraea]EQD87028.1 lipase [Saccharopolyspora erythraea D]PFG98080.1 triacylglycerol lipase [Saccharopolyspora erythraea NRRL 2338]QRK88191.1 lipase [Saccharopolyspora erythraea]CAM04442.1 secreted lipase [Saccharopolyspora erythraea NRRL 2338]